MVLQCRSHILLRNDSNDFRLFCGCQWRGILWCKNSSFCTGYWREKTKNNAPVYAKDTMCYYEYTWRIRVCVNRYFVISLSLRVGWQFFFLGRSIQNVRVHAIRKSEIPIFIHFFLSSYSLNLNSSEISIIICKWHASIRREINTIYLEISLTFYVPVREGDRTHSKFYMHNEDSDD